MIATPDHRSGGPNEGEVWIGLILGTLFGQTSIVAGWTVLGATRIVFRLPISCFLLACTLLALAMSPLGRDDPSKIATVIGLPIIGLWIFAQLPLWLLRWMFGLRLCNRSHTQPDDSPTTAQFGLRQLMLFTLLTGIVLGIGRIVLPRIAVAGMFAGETPIFLFLVLVAILQSLPLMFAVLLPRWWTVGTLVVLALIAVGTATELPLFNRFGASGPNVWHLIWINVFTVTWVLAFAGVARLCGYRLLAHQRDGKQAMV